MLTASSRDTSSVHRIGMMWLDRCRFSRPQVFYKVAGGPLWFGLPVTSISNSLVTLDVVADSLQLVTNLSPGKILSAQACIDPPPSPSDGCPLGDLVICVLVWWLAKEWCKQDAGGGGVPSER